MREETKRVLVAVDGSDQAMSTIGYVGSFFPPAHTHVVLFHVAGGVPESFLDLGKGPDFRANTLPVDAWARDVQKAMEAFMERGKEVLLRAGFPADRVVPKIQRRKVGIARDVLREAAQAYDAVVVGRSGVSDLKDVVVGSVAHKLVSRVNSIPVGVVGGTPETQKVLIGFDGSEGSMRAVDFVCSMLAGKDRVILLCLLVRSLGIHAGSDLVFSLQHESAWLRSISRQIEPSFPEAEARLIDAGFHPDHVYIRILENVRSRAESLTRAAKEDGFGTLVVGRRGLSVVKEFTMGRVTRKVLHMADQRAVWIV